MSASASVEPLSSGSEGSTASFPRRVEKAYTQVRLYELVKDMASVIHRMDDQIQTIRRDQIKLLEHLGVPIDD